MGNPGLVLMGGAMLSKFLIQFPVDGQGCVPSLLFSLRPNCGRDNGNSNLLQKDLFMPCCIQCPDPTAGHCRATPLPEAPGHSQASLAQSLVGTLLLSPGSWCTQSSVCVLKEFISQSCVSSSSSMVELMATSSKRAYAIPKSAAPKAPVPVADHC